MKKILLSILFSIFITTNILACSCYYPWDGTFNNVSRDSKFVALVKVISFGDYFEDYDEQIPYSMTVEIIKKYKGNENRETIKIFGDNGFLCRPYLSNFELGKHYLIAPLHLRNSQDVDYELFICRTDYLEVDINSNKAYGQYSWVRRQIDLDDFEDKLENGDWDLLSLLSFMILILLAIIIVRIRRKQSAIT